ncbi:MAG: sigma-70 family RNA polymerase sigma factor, partial [Paramuribaculum sp.]|nr:sigma-70 family RNA polymerase sigma factor [Paramuribaculum sp.]
MSEVSPQLLATARSILISQEEAADAVQDTLLRLWSMRDRLDSYDTPAAVAALILRRLCIMALRGRKTSVGLEEAMR